MPNKPFGKHLQDLIDDSGLTRMQIRNEIEHLYGADIVVSLSDMSAYLSGQRLPRLDKFAALMDVLGARHADIAKLIRSVPRRTQHSGG